MRIGVKKESCTKANNPRQCVRRLHTYRALPGVSVAPNSTRQTAQGAHINRTWKTNSKEREERHTDACIDWQVVPERKQTEIIWKDSRNEEKRTGGDAAYKEVVSKPRTCPETVVHTPCSL